MQLLKNFNFQGCLEGDEVSLSSVNSVKAIPYLEEFSSSSFQILVRNSLFRFQRSLYNQPFPKAYFYASLTGTSTKNADFPQEK